MKTFENTFKFKRSAFIFIFLGIASFSFSQQQIQGIIKDSQDEPIAYAFIKTSSNPIGVVANEKGEFQINVNENPKDSLFITHIGFKKFACLPIRKNLYQITLENSTINLEEVAFVEFRGISLIKRIKNNLSKNYPLIPCSQEIYFNYEAKNDKLFLGYFDGNLNINIENYDNPNHRLKPRLLDANINLNNFNKIGNFYYVSSETILSYIFPTNLPFMENEDDYKFLVSKFNLAGHSYYKVNFEPKIENEKWRYLGNFIVDAQNYAIEEAEFSLVKNPDNNDVSINIGFSPNKIITTTNKESLIVKYKKEDSKYYNAFLKYSSHSSFYDSKIKSTKEITIDAVSMTTSFAQKPSKEQKEYGKPFNLFTLKTQKNGPKVDKNSYFGIDLEQKIKQLKLDNPELRE